MNKIKRNSLIFFAGLLIIVGNYFFKFPNNFCFGGVMGLSVLLAEILPFSTGVINFIANGILLIVAFAILDRKFAKSTVFVSIEVSIGLVILEKIYPIGAPLTDEPMLELIFATFIPSVGAAILFNCGSSSGGTDIIAMIIKKHTEIENIAIALFFVDLAFTILAVFVFDIKIALFSFVGLVAKTSAIDNIIENFNLCKDLTIICNNKDDICRYINEKVKRGATIVEAQGAYSHDKKYIIITVMKRHQAYELKSYIRSIEPTAFITINSTSEIIGRGF